jgi:predicted permease
MSITWTEDSDSRANLGPGAIMQQNSASFGASDYVNGGYLIVPAAFGLSRIRALLAVAATGNALGYVWNYNASASSLISYQSSASNGQFVQTASNTDFSGNGGSLKLLAFGY